MTTWLAASVSQVDLFILVSMSAFTSMITAAVGIGGGVLLLAVLAQMIPVQALIPVHGLVQLGSNGNRAYMTRQYIDWKMSRLFILFLVWGPKPKTVILSDTKLMIAGGVTTILSAFVGAAGPLVAAFVHRQNMDKLPTVATFATLVWWVSVTGS